MIIKDDDLIYNLPLKEGINILVNNDYSKDLMNYLMSYFMNKKKNSCSIYDDDRNIIMPKEFDLIYISNRDLINNYNLKDKSIIKSYFTEVILKNSEMFLSIDNIRDNMHSLLTDSGMYKIKKILQTNLDINYELKIEEFDIGKLIDMLKIDINNIDESILMASLYNLVITINRFNNNIIYIDFDINDKIEKWLLASVESNDIVLINSECIHDLSIIEKCNVIVPSNGKSIEFDEMNISNINLFLYMINPYTQRYLHYQKEKNINFIQNYIAKETTFSINFK